MLAQTYTNVNSVSSIKNLRSKASQLNLLFSQQLISPNTIKSVTTSNAIHIQQIGNYNHVASNTGSIISDINIFQIGNKNKVLLNINSVFINENVIQRGYNNKFIDFSLKGTILHRVAVIQKGMNQKLIWYGSNSISKKMTVRMRGKNQTVIIRNFKR